MTLRLPHLPESFYDEHPTLKAILRAAHADRTPPDVVLLATLGRVAATIPVTVTVNDAPLNFIGAFIGSSGSGKSSGHRTAWKLLSDVGTELDGLNVGSGEGIVQAYMARGDDGSNVQRHQAAVFHVDEGEHLLKVGKRDGSTTLDVIRSAWGGENIGMTNARAETTRRLKQSSYRFVLLIGLQPPFAADLLADQTAGTPQRFLWAAAGDPTAPPTRPPFPGPLELPPMPSTPFTLDSDVRRIVDERQRRTMIEGGHDDPYESHATQVQLRVAAILEAMTTGRSHVTPATWNLATMIVDNSRQVRAELLRHHERSQVDLKVTNEVQRQHVTTEARERVHDAMIDRIGRVILNYVEKKPHATKSDTHGALRSTDRKHHLEALGRLLTNRQLIESNGRYNIHR